MEPAHHAADTQGKNSYSATQWFWPVLAVAAFIGLGPASECLGFTVNPTTLTFNAVRGVDNPPKQTLSIYWDRAPKTAFTASDNASWLSVFPATISPTSSALITVTVNARGLAVGTYKATITIKVGTNATTKVPVTLTVTPSQLPPLAATLEWNPVSNPTLVGYKIYVGTTSGHYTRTITVGNVTSYTVTGLTRGVVHYFAVTAYSNTEESALSQEVSKRID